MVDLWPALPLNEWNDTKDTLHMWTQIVGKIRLANTPLLNHWWNCTLYMTPRGLSTDTIPDGTRIFKIDFDFIDHKLLIECSDATTKSISLYARSVADFHKELMATLSSMGIEVVIHGKPDEVADPIPFAEDNAHASYDSAYANRFWRILLQVDRLFKVFRARFIGKCSPVHFFWGSFDLAVTRFSGRIAPARPGADAITREAYSHEVSSAGFWPGSGSIQGPAFYSYTSPMPEHFGEQPVRPSATFFSTEMSEYFLMYDDVRAQPSADEMILDFLQTTYEAGAKPGNWDRASLERA